MDFRLIQDAERQMLRDGKSAAAIDAMKSAYRKQMFNPDGYSQTAGLGSFASGGEAYGPPPVSGPVPQGIASFQDGGEAESFFSRFNPLTGSYRKKKPLSVRAAETAIDFSPLAAVKTGQEIYEESQSEDPSLLKMGIMAAGEAAGLIPVAGPAVKTMVRRVPADLADEIASQKISPEEMFSEDVYHYSKGDFEGDTFDSSRSTKRFDRLGTHVGTKEAAKDRAKFHLGNMDAEQIFDLPEGSKGGSTMPLRARVDKPFLNENGEVFSEEEVREIMNNYADQNKIADLDVAMEAFKKDLTDNGFTHVPYKNNIEGRDPETGERQISYIMLTDRTQGDPAVLKGRFSKFDDVYDPRLMKADGGEVMRGIASFQDGGEADKVREFGNLEYEVEMNPFLEPISRAGFDPNVVKVMQNAGSHYNPNTDEIIIGNYTGTANLSEQAHEFRHRGLEKVASEFFLNIPTLKREMPPEDFKRLLDFFETMEEQRFRKRGVGGGFGRPGSEEYKFDRQEMIAEFFEEPYEYNLPAQYYAATGEDPASAKFQRVMNINPETKEPYTDEERAAYAARTGTVIKKMLPQDTVQDQMDRLETVGQDEFRTFAGADPKTRTGDEIFKQAMLVQEFARKQNATAKKYSDGGAVMRGIGTLNETARNMTRGPRGIGAYQQFADGGVVPRQTMINNQPHMLAYINPEEEQMLLENGGAGLPGPGGVPAYWKLFEPSTWKGGSNYTPGAGFEGFTSSSSSAPEKSLRPQSRPISIYNPSDNGNNDGGAAPVAAPEPKPQGIMGLLYDKAKDFFNPNSQKIAAMRGSGIKGNPDDPRNQGLTMFPGPISMGLKGLAYLGGLRKTDPIVKVTDDKNVYQSGAGGFYIINSVTGLPMMVESPDDLSLSSDAKARMDAMMTDMNKSDNDNGPGSCGPGYVYDYSAGACVPMIGTTATSESDALGTPQSIVVPDPVYLPVGLAEGGEVEEPLSEYQRALIASESSGRSNVVNDRGYRGLTQAGDAALADFKDQEGLNFSDEQYLNSPELQMQFQKWYEQKTIDYVMDKGLDAYIGKVIKGVPITMSSLLGMAHIGGDFGMQQFLETGGRYDPNDGKTSLSDYGRKFANMALYAESGGAGFNPVTPEETLMSMPVEQEGSLQFYRPKARPPEIEFSAPATSLRPIARPEEMMEPELKEIDASMQPRRQRLREKYSLANMAEALTQQEPVGIMSATR